MNFLQMIGMNGNMVSKMSTPLYHNDEKQSAISEPAKASLNIRALQSSQNRSTPQDRRALLLISRDSSCQKIAAAVKKASLPKRPQQNPLHCVPESLDQPCGYRSQQASGTKQVADFLDEEHATMLELNHYENMVLRPTLHLTVEPRIPPGAGDRLSSLHHDQNDQTNSR
jgi:hypothetical protein